MVFLRHQSFAARPPHHLASAVRLTAALALLALGGVACVVDDGVEWEPEPVPEFEPEPDVREDCFSNRDCELAGFGTDAQCIDFMCFAMCANNRECFPSVCVTSSQICRGCDADNPCDPGQRCTEDRLCEEAGDYFDIDFSEDIVPLFKGGNCALCHRQNNPLEGSDLVFDVSDDVLFSQLQLQNRVVAFTAADSTIYLRPVREDPPDHPVGVWNPTAPEAVMLADWININPGREGRCRSVAVGDGMLDCYEGLSPQNYCSTLAGEFTSSTAAFLEACADCSVRFSAPPVDNCPGVEVDGGPLDAGAPDAGPPPDAGAPDAGASDAGAPDAGASDAGASDAGEAFDAGPALPDWG